MATDTVQSYYTSYYEGLGSTSAYAVAGKIFQTGSAAIADGITEQIDFPSVTRRIVVRNVAADAYLRVHFREKSAGNVIGGHHYTTVLPLSTTVVNQPSTLDLHVKCRRVFISNDSGEAGAYELFAELTDLRTDEMFELTGSGVTD